MTDPEQRRPLASRNTQWAQLIAKKLAQMNISPNQISILSIIFGLLSLIFFLLATTQEYRWMLFLAAGCIQLRLLCNLMDGMIAIEYKKKSAVGDLYNEIPDRIADALIILGAGLCVQKYDGAMSIAWACIFLATLTAYIRALGASLIQKHYFLGPMAKPHRMFTLTVSGIAEYFIPGTLYAALIVMLVLLVFTNARRTLAVARELSAR